MKQLLGVSNSDSMNLYGTRFTVGALVSALWDNCEIGNPLLLRHDFLRPVGWNRPVAVHIESSLTRSVSLSLVPETQEESEQISRSLNAYLQMRLVEECKPEIEKLRSTLSPFLQGQGIAFRAECVAFVEPGLTSRVFSNVLGAQDKDGLIPLNHLTPIGPGAFQVDGLVFFAHPFFRRSLSRLNTLNVPFLERIQGIAGDEVDIEIAIDTDMVGLASTYRERGELEYWWGPKFDDNLASIPTGVTHHEASEYERLFHGISGTQFWWQSRRGQHILEVEELRDIPSVSANSAQYGCRYAHSIVQETTGQTVHFDGAIRMYSEDQMIERLTVDIAHSGRHTQYTKLWRIDGVIAIPVWKRLLSDYFRDNHLIGEYLGAPAEEKRAPYADRSAEAQPLLTEYVPYSMTDGMGIRVALSYHPCVAGNTVERRAVSLDTLSSEDEHISFVESDAIELKKALERLNASLSIAEGISFLNCKDFYANLPLILHSEATLPESLYTTLDAIRMLVQAWNRKGFDKVVSYSVGFPVQDRECRISVLGHIADLEEWLSHPLSNPPTSQDGIRDWAEEVSSFLGRTFHEEAHDEPPLFDTLMTSGVLLIKRRAVEGAEYRSYYSDEHRALVCELAISKDEAAWPRALETETISVAPAILILDSRCTRCGLSYPDCSCSKLLDEGVAQEITEMRIAFPFWTDRPVW